MKTGKSRGEATEVGMLEAARELGIDVAVTRRESRRRALNRFDPTLRLMSTIDQREDGSLTVHAKGAPEEILERSTTIGGPDDHTELRDVDRDAMLGVLCSAMRRRGCACSPSRVAGFRRAMSLQPIAKTRSASSACSGSSGCSIRHGPRFATPSRNATRRVFGFSS